MDVLINLSPQSDFEKNLYLTSHNKELIKKVKGLELIIKDHKIYIGKLKSEIDHLDSELESNNQSVLKRKINKLKNTLNILKNIIYKSYKCDECRENLIRYLKSNGKDDIYGGINIKKLGNNE